MSKLCEAFNRINSRFGANRVKMQSVGNYHIEIKIVGLGVFCLNDRVEFVEILERVQGYGTKTRNSVWLTDIANGKIRDEAGNMVDPENQVSSTTAFEVGDLIKAVPPYALACGSGIYNQAVLVSVDPFVAVSEQGDMMWSSTIAPEKVQRIGKSSPEVLEVATKRFESGH